jgi:hypothetical protein
MSETETKEVETAQTAAPQPQAQADAGPELTIQDLNALKSIIDVASQRGAFKPNEMVTVGQTYSKLEAFLNAIAAQQGQNTQGA